MTRPLSGGIPAKSGAEAPLLVGVAVGVAAIVAGSVGAALARPWSCGGRGGTITGALGSTLKIRKRSTPSAILRLWSSESSSSVGASKRIQR